MARTPLDAAALCDGHRTPPAAQIYAQMARRQPAGLPLLAAALAVVVTGLAFSRSRGPAELDSPEP